ncbi:MAG TPA: GAF domain-containing protein, partial [candidate division Zixibacteria bacterium]|nr:GAF domain-containing protein [candidate division Zixibacteria bacterium]
RLAHRGGPPATPAAVARTVVEALRTHLAIPRAAVYLARDGSDGAMHLEAHAGYPAPPPPTLDPATAEHHDGAVTDGRPQRRHLLLRAGNERLGVLVLEDEADGPLSRVRPGFLRTVATAAAADLQTARVIARARREVARARALRQVTRELTGKLDLNAVLDEIVERTQTLFEADKVGLWLLDDGERPFRVAAARGLGEAFLSRVRELTLATPAIGVRAVRERRTFVLRHADRRPGIGSMQEAYRAEGIRTACLVPLVSLERSLGVIALYHTRDRDWPDDEVSLAQAFANQAVVAISNARLYRSVADQAARMRSIQDLSARLNRLTDVQAIADAIVAEASTLAAYHDIRVYTVDWERGMCEPVAFTDRLLGEGDFREALRVPIGEGSFTGWVAEHGEPILANDALNDPRGLTIVGTDDIEESMLVVPMLFEGRSVGVIALSKLGRDQFTDDDLQTMTIFAGYAAQAVANAAAYERLELQSAELARQLQSQRRLLEINERLLSTLDQADVLETIADGLRAVVDYDNLSIYRADEVNRVLVPVLTRERHAEEVARYVVPFGGGLMGWALEHNEPVLANDALNDPRAMQVPGTPADPEALVVVPLVAEGEVIGCLNISRVGGEEVHFSEADFELVKLFAGQASIALRNAETHHAVSLRADTDALTGLGNHGAFQRALADVLGQPEGTELKRGRRGRAMTHGRATTPAEPIALLMMDLDNFKAYNDRLGHPAGDALLHAVGTAIYGAARTDDRVFRYGGDEFALILHGADADAAAAVAERVRRAVARLTADEPTPVTITIGVAAYPADATVKNDLIAAADTALYWGKQAGDGRVVRADEVPREIRDLRATLDELARSALRHSTDAAHVEGLVEAARRTAETAGRGEDSMRDALLAVARSLDARDPATVGHGDRVGHLARRIAEQLGCDGHTVSTIELAARLHGLELAGAEELESVASLKAVGQLVRWQRAGSTDRRLPLEAQIVAVANAYDTLLTMGGGRRPNRQAALEEIRRGIGPRYGPEVVVALAEVVGARRPARPRRRRRGDLADDEQGAA